MVEINLLPWRISQKSYAKKLLIKIMLFTSMMTILILAAGYYFLSLKESKSKDEIILLQEREQRNLQETASIQEKETQPISNEFLKELIKRKHLIQSLLIHLSKPQTHHICFSQIKQEKNASHFSGVSSSAIEFTEFMTRWSGAKIFSEIEIKELRKNAETGVMEFDFYAI